MTANQDSPVKLQEEFAGVVARVGDLSPAGMLRDGRGTRRLRLARRGGRRRADDCKECRSIEGLFEGLLSQSFGG
jgi:hypothetical protein